MIDSKCNISLLQENEFSLSSGRIAALSNLLEVCFPDTFQGRTYYKQKPNFRLFAELFGQTVGQIGIDFRVVRVGNAFIDIFGIVDLCVMPEKRRGGIASLLMDEAERLAIAGQVDAMVAMADRHDLYVEKGYHNLTPARCRWLAIDDVRSIDLVERNLDYCFMYKNLKDKPWPSGNIDLLGHLF